MSFWAWFGLIVGLAGAAIGIYASINPMGVGKLFLSMGVDNMVNLMSFGIPLLVLVIMGAAFAPFIASAMKNAQKKKRLALVGVKGKAKILSVQDTGLTVNNNPYIRVTVEMKPGSQATFQTMVSRVAIPRAGDMIEVIYDPADPSVVMPVMS